MSGGQVIDGGTVSLKLMVCTHPLLLPQASRTIHVRRIALPLQGALESLSTKVMLATALHVAVAVATPVMLVVGATVHSSVMSSGQTMLGGTVSLKLMVCTHPLLLPQASWADQVRRIVALPVQLVLDSLSTKLMFVTALHVSVAVATPVMFVVGETVHSSVISAGQTIAGGTVSLKLMVCTQPLLFPQESWADQVRRIIPLPAQFVVDSLSTKLMFVTALHVSVAVATPVMFVVGETVHSNVISAGQTIVGGTVSLKLMVCTQPLLFPQES
jgi:hypothetical protein